jgi:hypothetical protein
VISASVIVNESSDLGPQIQTIKVFLFWIVDSH